MEVPADWADIFLNLNHTAVVTTGLLKSHLYFPDNPYLPREEDIIPKINEFLRKARALGLPVIHTCISTKDMDACNKKYPMTFNYTWFMPMGNVQVPPEAMTMEGLSIETADTDFHIPGQTKLSPFYGTNLEVLLRNQDIDRIILLGSMTDCCVLQTAFDASDRGFRVVVPGDLCAGTRHLQDKALNIMSLHCALVTDSEKLIDEWESQKKG